MLKKGILVLCGLLLLLPAYSQVTLFSDTFDNTGEWIPGNGRWQIRQGQLVQSDAKDTITHISRIVKQSGKMEYDFELAILEGMEDKYAGFGLQICIDKPSVMRSWGQGHSYLCWLTYDEAAYGRAVFFAQFYRSRGPTRMSFWPMRQGDEFPVPADILDPARFITPDNPPAKLRIRLVIDLDTGKGRFYHPRAESGFFPIDLGAPLSGGMYLALRTNSLAVAVDNFSVRQLSD